MMADPGAYSTWSLHSDRVSVLRTWEGGAVSVGGLDGMVVLYEHCSYTQKED